MEKKFICIGEPYESQGEQKVFFRRIGEIFVAKNGKEYAKIYHIPNTLLHVYEDKPKQQQSDEGF